jgi:hypothetical protein
MHLSKIAGIGRNFLIEGIKVPNKYNRTLKGF